MSSFLFFTRRIFGAMALTGWLIGCVDASIPSQPDPTQPSPPTSLEMGKDVPADGTIAPTSGHSAASLKLTLDRSVERLDIGPRKPTRGDVFLVMSITIANLSGHDATIDQSLFSITTTVGTHIAASSTTTADLSKACADTSLIAANDSLACDLVFEIAQGDGDRLIYEGETEDEHINIDVYPPSECNLERPSSGLHAFSRVTSDAPSPLVRDPVADGKYILTHTELYTNRGVQSHQLVPASTVVIRSGLIQEASFDENGVLTRSLATLTEEDAVKLSCLSPSRAQAEVPRDRLFYSKLRGELVLERETPAGILRRFYR